MPRNQTVKSAYRSAYGGGFISASQYIAEILCEKLAIKQSKRLFFKFWNDKEWKKFFLYQITLANRLLKKFSASDIIKAIKSGDEYSLKSYTLLSRISKMAKQSSKESRESIGDIKQYGSRSRRQSKWNKLNER